MSRNQHGCFPDSELSLEAQNYLKAFTKARVAECLHLGPELLEAQREMKELAKELVGPLLRHRELAA